MTSASRALVSWRDHPSRRSIRGTRAANPKTNKTYSANRGAPLGRLHVRATATPKVVDRPPPAKHQDGSGASRHANAAHPLSPQALGTLGAVGEGEGSAHQIAALTIWLRQHGVDFTDRAQFVRVRHMGVGGVSTRAFDEGDVIFSLPLAAPKHELDRFGNRVESAKSDEDDDDAANHESALSPLVLTTSAVTAHSGPLGRLGRALSAAGLTTLKESTGARTPSRLLGGVVESDLSFPLDASKTTLLALGVLHQCCLAAGASPADAHWKAYTDLLPREVDSPLEWSEEELELLQGSRLVDRAAERITLVDSIYDEVFPRLNDADPTLWISGKLGSNVQDGTGIDVTAAARKKGERARDKYTGKEAFRWAWATVLARAFALPDVGEDGEMGLCPGLDLFNHGSEAEKCEVRGVPGASLELDEDDPHVGPRVVLRCGVGGAESGEQLFHDYADRSSGGALLEFGFTHTVRACTKPIDGRNNIVERHHDEEGLFDGLDENWALAASNDDAAAGDECEECSLTEESDHHRRALHAVDISLKPVMAMCEKDTVAARLEALAEAGLCGGLTWEVSNVDRKFPAGERRLHGIECVPETMIRAARVLSLTNEELDHVGSLNAGDGDKWTASEALSHEHERRTFQSLASIFRGELVRYAKLRGKCKPTTVVKDAAIADCIRLLASGDGEYVLAAPEMAWAAQREEVAGCVAANVRDEDGGKTAADQEEEGARAARWRRRALMAVEVRRGEKLLLGEVAGEFEKLAGDE